MWKDTLLDTAGAEEPHAEWIRARIPSHGSARAANAPEREPFMFRKNAPSFLQLGRERETGTPTGLTDTYLFEHLILVAPSGAGKSSRVILPGLLTETGKHLLYINDSKSEIWPKTAGYLSQYYRLWRFAPMDAEHSHGFNPLANVHNQADADDLAHSFILNTGTSGSDAFWDETAELIISAAILHLVDSARQDGQGCPPLVELARLLNQPRDQLYNALMHSPSAAARRMIRGFFSYLDSGKVTETSIMLGILHRFRRLTDEHTAQVTSINEIDFDKMLDDPRPTALYMSIPDTAAERLQPLSAIFLRQAFTCWLKRADAMPDQRLSRPLLCYLDELCNSGKIPRFENLVTTCRSRGIGLLTAFQAFSQLADAYGENDTKTIRGSNRTHLVFSGLELEEAEYYSRRMGVMTVHTETRSTTSDADKLFTQPTSQGTVMGETGRPYMTADEIHYMPEEEMILLSRSVRPIHLLATPYYRDKELLHRSRIPYHFKRPRPLPLPDLDFYHDLPPEEPAAEEHEQHHDKEHGDNDATRWRFD